MSKAVTYRPLLPGVPKPTGKVIPVGYGITGDIITELVRGYYRRKGDISPQTALYFRRANLMQTLAFIHAWVRQKIKYQLDPFGKQNIQRPAVTLQRKKADCKGYSILIASILSALGIPAAFRFISEQKDGQFRHVYIMVRVGGRFIPLDACLPQPFTQSRKITNILDVPLWKQ